jgi:hypothetical protein
MHTNEEDGDRETDATERVVDVETPLGKYQCSSNIDYDGTPYQRQDVFSTSAPPTTGPTIVPMDQAPRTIAKYFGRCLRGTMSQKITWVTVIIPPPPMPWMERPVSKMVKLWAAEHRIVPTVNYVC